MVRTTKAYGYYDKAETTASAGSFLHIPIGSGLFKANLMLNTNDTNASVYWISFRCKDAAGNEDDLLIDSGLIDLENHAHVQGVEFEGPGSFTAYLLPANAPSSMTFIGYIRRVKP